MRWVVGDSDYRPGATQRTARLDPRCTLWVGPDHEGRHYYTVSVDSLVVVEGSAPTVRAAKAAAIAAASSVAR